MRKTHAVTDWLPTSRKEMDLREWDELDVIIISGDAYVDHPSFGHAVVARAIEGAGKRVGVIPQPNWRDDLRDFRRLGRPRLFFGITAGCMDSMVNHYTANRRLRSDDAYTAGGKSGFRPDRAITVYTRILKNLYPDVPVVIGGMEASMRRVSHYDYWGDTLRPTILEDSGADLLVYGMGEQPILEILRLLDRNVPFSSLKTIPQTCFLQPSGDPLPKNRKWSTKELASYEECLEDKRAYARNFKYIEREASRLSSTRFVQKTGDRMLIVNPPFRPMTEKEIDASFDLPYTRLPHPRYEKRGPIPAYEMIKFSITMHRGCFGGCSFCAISAHQGKMVVSRSKASILREVDRITSAPDFKGYISDLGGPSANMYRMKGKDKGVCDMCAKPSCIHPRICVILDTDHAPLLEIYRSVSSNPKVKKAFVSSGVRYDLFLSGTDEGCHREYMEELLTNHVSGRLKVAPEHTSERVLKMMRKPSFRYFRELKREFDGISFQKGLKQELIPYFISSHPGCGVADMAELAAETADMGYRLEQVQDFTPTPMTLATVIYHSGLHPNTMEEVYTAKSRDEKLGQRKFFFWYRPENREYISNTLRKLGLGGLLKKLFKGGSREPSAR